MKVGDFLAGRSKLKIKVLKKMSTEELFGDKPPLGQIVEACTRFEVGQEFVVGEDGGMPEGFCHWAWNDLYKVITTLTSGGNFPWMNEKGTSVSCCTDGFRPVIFEIRRID